jgi:hypothetical protein
VPLKISPVDLQEGIRSDTQIKEIQEWAKSLLLDSKKGKQVMFIQADPGRGKSAFCQIFSDLVRKNFHPFWVPILIKLRDIESFDNSLGNTLSTAINRQFATKGNWLTSDNYRFLFILDGFDELRLEGRSKGGLERLINQIASFQERCNISINHHRFIVTGRQLALQGINFLPENLERVKILPMDENSQQQWLTKWEAVIDDNPTIAKQKVESFKTFLRSPDLHREVKEELAKEPLLLYLLASLHRDGNIDINQLSGDNKIRNKISIYDRAFDCVLTQQRTVQLQQEIVGLKIEYLKQISRETGLATIQARGESARIITIENRLAKSSDCREN